MRKLIILVMAVLCAQPILLVGDELPLNQLQKNNNATFKYGTITLQAWRVRDNFPEMKELSMMELSERKREDGIEYQKGKAYIVVGKDKLGLGTQGRIENAPESYDWAPILIFTPENPGTFNIAGKLTLHTKEEDEKNISWAVVKIDKEGKMNSIAFGKGKKGDIIDIAKEVGVVTLKDWETLGITAWRHAYHWWGDVNLTEFSINK